MFLHMYTAVPFGEERWVPVAVISSHVSEHSMSTTTLPFVPAEVPCTLMSVQGARKVDGISVQLKIGKR